MNKAKVGKFIAKLRNEKKLTQEQLAEKLNVTSYKTISKWECGTIPDFETMEKLSKEGIAFSLDDFGKGESNLGYLIDMPVSILKLDMDITKAYKTNKKAKIN